VADQDDFPTAIIPTRPGSFERRYDDLAKELGDPLKKMFLLQASAEKEETQLAAASKLVERRYPKPAAPPFAIQANEGSSLVINFGSAPLPLTPGSTDPVDDAIDVTPAPAGDLEEMLK
jgi:hypothetical protein